MMRKRTAGGGTKEGKKYRRDTLEEEEELQQVNPYHDAQLEYLKVKVFPVQNVGLALIR